MMSIEIVISLFGIFITVVVQALYVAYKLGTFEEKLSAIEKKQDKHNSVIERQYKTESDIEVLFEKIDVENHRIADLENKM